MSVIIKGMKMPPNCLYCPFLKMSLASGDYCGLRKKTVKDFNSRLKTCPLIELQPHGRLIDADALIERAWRLKLDTRELIVEMINSAPTIIPAEEGE